MIELTIGASILDTEYFKNLKTQAEIIIHNFRQLISDTYFIEDVHVITALKKHIRFIKAQGGQIALYEDDQDGIVYLKSSLNTIECLFYDILVRINRSVLINPKKIQGVDKEFDAKGKKARTIINVDGEIFAISENMIDALPKDIKKKFLKDG